MRASSCLGSVVDKLVILNFMNHGHIANICSGRGINELGVEGLVVSDCTIIILELVESDATDFNAGLSGGWAGLGAQVVHKHVLVVSESVFNISMMEHNISTIVLSIATRSENDSIRDTDSGGDCLDDGVVLDLRCDLESTVADLQIANILMLESSADQSGLSST